MAPPRFGCCRVCQSASAETFNDTHIAKLRASVAGFARKCCRPCVARHTRIRTLSSHLTVERARRYCSHAHTAVMLLSLASFNDLILRLFRLFLFARDALWCPSQAASTQLISGSTLPLESSHGRAFVQRWTRTSAFTQWAARNGVSAALRLWRARHDGSSAEHGSSGGGGGDGGGGGNGSGEEAPSGSSSGRLGGVGRLSEYGRSGTSGFGAA
eukprot:3849603-Pleurochrysis_carterae.AAC.1